MLGITHSQKVFPKRNFNRFSFQEQTKYPLDFFKYHSKTDLNVNPDLILILIVAGGGDIGRSC